MDAPPAATDRRVIQIRVDAPRKPAPGQACNGCGLCCLTEPCPVGMLASQRRDGACHMLEWDEGAARYVCGLLTGQHAPLPVWLRPAAPLLRRSARRLIAAGIGCDCTLEVESDVEAQRPRTPTSPGTIRP
ncbi:MAG: hypothetical protein RJB37_32 [Pseudomonadota bacterium]|jgi:hypothetical protein